MEENKKKFDWKFAGFIAVFIMLIISLAKINVLSNEISNLQGVISGYQNQVNNLRSDINSIYDNVDERLKKEASLLSSVYYSLGELNTEEHTIPVTVKLTPKHLTDDTKITMNVEGQTVSFERNGNEFSASFPVNMFITLDDYPMLSIVAGGTTKTEQLENVVLSNLYSNYLPIVYAHISPFDKYKDGKLTIDSHLSYDVKPSSQDSKITVTKAELVTEKNGKEIDRTDISDMIGKDSQVGSFNKTYDVKYGDTLSIYAITEDSLGYIHKSLAYHWHQIDENTSEAVTLSDGSEQIYDKNGEMLTKENE